MLAIDLGAARVGVAACDAGHILAYPVNTIPAGDDLPQRVAQLVDEYEAVALVVGYPLNLDGTAGIAAHNVLRQAHAIGEVAGVPVWLVDERMSTAQAQRRLHETGHSVKTARAVIDAQAAVGILDSVLSAANQAMTIGKRLEEEEADGQS